MKINAFFFVYIIIYVQKYNNPIIPLFLYNNMNSK